MWMDVDAALAEVPVNIMPLIDDTDFKTRETAIVFNQAGMDLVWNFVTTAGAMTQTAVTPTTAGVHDWTNQGDGMYSLEIPASSGTINNDTEGFGWFSGFATGVLPWRGPVIGFRAAALNNALIDGGDVLDVNVTEWLGTAAATPTVAGVPEVDLTHMGGVAQSAADLKDFADAGYDPATNKVEGVKVNDDMRGTDGANTVVPDAAGVAPTAIENRQEMDTNSVDLDAIQSNQTTINSNVLAIPTTAMRGTDNAALASVATEARLAELDAANLPADIDDIPNTAEFEARTPTAAQLAYIVANAARGVPVTFTTAGGTTTNAVLNLVDGASASTTADQYNSRLLVFDNGTLKDAVTDITDYDGAGNATITALPFAPTAAHTARLI